MSCAAGIFAAGGGGNSDVLVAIIGAGGAVLGSLLTIFGQWLLDRKRSAKTEATSYKNAIGAASVIDGRLANVEQTLEATKETWFPAREYCLEVDPEDLKTVVSSLEPPSRGAIAQAQSTLESVRMVVEAQGEATGSLTLSDTARNLRDRAAEAVGGARSAIASLATADPQKP